jgi:hypothetical protein
MKNGNENGFVEKIGYTGIPSKWPVRFQSLGLGAPRTTLEPWNLLLGCKAGRMMSSYWILEYSILRPTHVGFSEVLNLCETWTLTRKSVEMTWNSLGKSREFAQILPVRFTQILPGPKGWEDRRYHACPPGSVAYCHSIWTSRLSSKYLRSLGWKIHEDLGKIDEHLWNIAASVRTYENRNWVIIILVHPNIYT